MKESFSWYDAGTDRYYSGTSYEEIAAQRFAIPSLWRRFVAAHLERARKDAEERQGVARESALARVAYWERQANN